MIETLASFQDITTILASFAGIMAISSLALDDLIAKVDGYFSFYNEDEEAERRIE